MNTDDSSKLSPVPAEDPAVSSPGPTVVLVVVDDAGTIQYVSASGRDLTGKAPEDLVGVDIGVIAKHGRTANAFSKAVVDAIAAGTCGGIGRFWLGSTGRADALVEVFVDATRSAETGSVDLVLLDVTGDYVDEQRMRGSAEGLGHPLANVDMAVTRWTPALELDFHTPSFEPLVMATHELLLTGPGLEDVGLTPRARRTWRDALRQVIDAAVPVELDWETDDGRHIHSRAVAELGEDGFVSSILVVSHDVTEERERYEELTRRALHDPLTGLANRATVLAHIERSLGRRGRSGTSEAAIYIDLDRFKAMNDSLGHGSGDELLVTVAKRLSSVVRPHDVVGRLGGDEFVVFLEQMEGIEPVLMIVERLRASISQPMVIGGRELSVKTSMGVAFAAERDESAEDLLAKADAAMYKAKTSGRDRFELYDEELRVRAEKRTRSEQALRRAMRNGEMEVHFLPEFDLVSGGVVGAEALLRWQHPERGLLPAAEFIGLAEESGLLVHLGTEVLRRSCELVAGWLRSRPIADFTLRVNISPRQLAQPTLAPVVEEILEATRLEPSVLCLELAEATLTAEIEESVRQIERLREAGVKISVDDFGTAASSLALLKVLPVDMLKIDMSFVRTVDTDPRDEAIVKAIIDIGRALDLEVVAEGIDSDDQLEVLLELGCGRGQGYGLSKVLRPNELLRRWM